MIKYQEMNLNEMKVLGSLLRYNALAVIIALLTACHPDAKVEVQQLSDTWNPPNHFTLIDKDTLSSLNHLRVTPNLDSASIRQLVYVAVNTDVFLPDKGVRLRMSNTLCIRNVSVDEPIIVNDVEYYDADGIKLKEYLDHPVELRPLQSIWLILPNDGTSPGTGTNFLVDWASMNPVPEPIIESMMAGSYSQMGLSFRSESVVVKEWINGTEHIHTNHCHL